MVLYGYNNKKNQFTIWDLTFTYEPLDEYRRYKIYNYKYVGKTNEEQENLDSNVYNRARSFSTKEIEYTNNEVFRFGKYCNKKIQDVCNINYTCWYYEQIHDENHKKFIHNWLYDHYCNFELDKNGNERVLTPKYLKIREEQENKKNDILKKANNGDSIYLEITQNPNSNGEIKIDGITYTFPKVVERFYEGWPYYIPVKNGQAKRIKNKTILAHLLSFGNTIFISNFEIVK